MDRVLLVGNPTAQSGKNAARIERALELFRGRGVAAELFPTLPAGRTVTALAERLDRGDHAVAVAMGGDGTFREVAAGVLTCGRPDAVAMGMLPTGTANDQGKSFGLEASAEALPRNVEVVCAGRETRLDAGDLALLDEGERRVGGGLFFDSAGWGLSARVLSVRNRDREVVAGLGPLKHLYRDHLVYAGALLRTFVESQLFGDEFTAHVEADGRDHHFNGLTDLVVKGTRIYGGSWVFDKTSKHDDGAFELITFRGKAEWASKAIVDLDGNPIDEAMLNEIGVEHSRPIRASRFTITLAPESETPIFAQMDGEELASSPIVRVTVLPRALRLIVP